MKLKLEGGSHIRNNVKKSRSTLKKQSVE